MVNTEFKLWSILVLVFSLACCVTNEAVSMKPLKWLNPKGNLATESELEIMREECNSKKEIKNDHLSLSDGATVIKQDILSALDCASNLGFTIKK